MVCAPVRLIIPSLKLGDYLSVQAHKPCSISHIDSVLFPIISIVKNGKKTGAPNCYNTCKKVLGVFNGNFG